jgi:hypothetical protein
MNSYQAEEDNPPVSGIILPMTHSDDEFYAVLLATFREDAEELLTGITEGLIKLKKQRRVLILHISKRCFHQRQLK